MPRARLGGLAAAAAALALTLASPAWAGTAKVYSCKLPDGRSAPTDGWTKTTEHYGQGSVGAEDRCETAGQLNGFFYSSRSTWSPGPFAGWVFNAPASTRITHARLYRALAGLGSGAWYYSYYAAGRLIEDRSRATDFAGTWDGPVADGSSLVIQLACGSGDNCHRVSGSITAAQLILSSATITLRDDADPTVSNVAGRLATQDTLRGSETMTFSASDSGMGVYRAVLEVDGRVVSSQVVNDNGGRCADAAQDATLDYEFKHAVPCKLATSGELSLDTTELSEGEHTLRVRVEDATGNAVTAVGPRTVVVDNVPAPAPAEGSRPTIEGSPRAGEALRAVPGRWTGENVSYAYQWLRCDADGGSCVELGTGTGQQHLVSQRDVGNRLRVRVTGSNAEGASSATSEPSAVIAEPSTTENRTPAPQQPAPTPGDSRQPQDRGAPNGSGASDRVRLSAYAGTGRRTTVRARYGRSTKITGRLLDANGQPISGAVLQVQAGVRVPGSEFEDVGTVRTSRSGGYSYTLAAGPSRLVRFAYRSHVGDTQFADTTDVVVMVRAGVTLRPRPTKLRNGHVTTFSGSVGRPVPRRGVLVDLQVRVGKKWRTFAVARTARSGRYSFRYRFRNTYRTTTFRFRARARRDSQYPYLDGYSRIVNVQVRG